MKAREIAEILVEHRPLNQGPANVDDYTLEAPDLHVLWKHELITAHRVRDVFRDHKVNDMDVTWRDYEDIAKAINGMGSK